MGADILETGIKITTVLLSVAWVLVIPYARSVSAKLTKLLENQVEMGTRLTAIEVRNMYADKMQDVLQRQMDIIQRQAGHRAINESSV